MKTLSTICNEVSISIIFVILAVLFLDPFMLFMPHSFVYLLLAGFVVVFALFAGLLWKERAHDEREQFHAMLAGRVGYLLGTGTLVAGIIHQTIYARLDPWLVAALALMLLGKLGGHIYSKERK